MGLRKYAEKMAKVADAPATHGRTAGNEAQAWAEAEYAWWVRTRGWLPAFGKWRHPWVLVCVQVVVPVYGSFIH